VDDEMPKFERRRRLKLEILKINYYQKEYEQTSRSHDRTQRRKLREIDIDLEQAIRCIPP